MITFTNPLPGYAPPNVDSLFGASRSGGTRSHEGWDENEKTGFPVRAAAKGRVTLAGQGSSAAGLAITLSHGQGWTSFYCHLSRVDVRPGMLVEPGEIIGLVGETGNAEGPHLHFGFRHWGKPIDPLLVLAPEDGGMNVWLIQERLKAWGYDPGYIDGWFGPKTAAALLAFQGDCGLNTTGTIDHVTADFLMKEG